MVEFVHTRVTVFGGVEGKRCINKQELLLCPVTKRLDRATYIIIVGQQAQIYVQGGQIHWSILRILSA